MEEVLRQLLDAEQAGRQDAVRLEVAAAERLRAAHAEAEAIRQQARADTAQQVAELEQAGREGAERTAAGIARDADEAMGRLRLLRVERGPEAVARVVALLLGEKGGTG